MTYDALVHAMQAGVALDHANGSTDGEPKHLRVGVNSALCDSAAIAKLLIAKGIFTEEEYIEAVTNQMAEEVARYEKMLSAALGREIKLGGFSFNS